LFNSPWGNQVNNQRVLYKKASLMVSRQGISIIKKRAKELTYARS
jgi:hypothetical protein